MSRVQQHTFLISFFFIFLIWCCLNIIYSTLHVDDSKVLHSKLELESSSRNLSRKEFFFNFWSSILTSFFCNVRRIWNFQSSKTSKIVRKFSRNYSNFLALENAKTFQFLPFLISFGNFRETEKNGFFRKISKFRKPNNSETRVNEKFRKFLLLQGLKREDIKCACSPLIV